MTARALHAGRTPNRQPPRGLIEYDPWNLWGVDVLSNDRQQIEEPSPYPGGGKEER
jgi:hypothetical protein